MNYDLAVRSNDAARKITEAARKFRGSAEYPRVVAGAVAFREGDRRFRLSEVTVLYVEEYLHENRVTLEQACEDENHVRELIEVITS
jgi:hypothetical protein